MRHKSFTSEWEKAYWAAVLAVETNTLRQNIIRAECEIFKRLQQLSDGASDGEERRALMRATKALTVLRSERLAA
jgi:hypothetical protein